MQHSLILQPVIVLALWTFVMWLLLYATRIPATIKQNVDLDPQIPARDLMNVLPARVRWKAENYNHLMEQPTVFYAVAIALAIMNVENTWSLYLAWTYVGLRIAHSLFQAFVNIIIMRFVLFNISAIVLLILTIQAALQVFSI